MCAPSSPVSAPGQTLRLYGWNDPRPNEKLTYRWTVSSGAVQSAGANLFTWTLSSNVTGPQTADGELRSGATVLARCLVEIQIIPPGPTSAEISQAPGLYSYLLNAGTSPAFRTWQSLTPATESLRRVSRAREINALEVPDPPRAKAILGRLSLSQSGTYVVSSLMPFDQSSPPYLIQDLSQVTPDAASEWVEAFINEAAQQHEWNPETLASLVEDLRTTVHAITKSIFRPQWIFLR